MKLSIITINLNNAPGLAETIKSVVSQTEKGFEYIIIDGSSSDGSLDLIEKLAIDDKRLAYWISEPDSGIYNAMNKGIKQAKGDYCLFLNSGDCLYDNNVIKDLYQFKPTSDVISGDMEVIIDNEIRIMYAHKGENFTLDYFYPCDTLPHQATFIKRECFDKFGLYDEKLKIASDWKFFVELLVINNGTYQYFERIISHFDNQGVSSQLDNKALIDKETSEFIQSLMPKFVFDSYAKIYENKEMYKKHYNDTIEYKNLKCGDFSLIIKFLLWVKSLKKRTV